MNDDPPAGPSSAKELPPGVNGDSKLLAAQPAGLDYEVLRRIGRGGYGEVWLVRDKSGGYQACKVIYRESFADDRPYEREYEGIKSFEPLSRANESQVKVLHVGRRDQAGYFYYIMELADDVRTGQSIQPECYVPKTLRTELARRGRLPIAECVQIGMSLSATLDHLHANGLIHRDVKPANIIFVHGLPKLADIGLVTHTDVSISYVGTEGYIPPEGPTSPQADIYGLGKVLYEISTGRDRQSFPELPTDLGDSPDHRARLEFNAIVTRACQAEMSHRYATAREMHDELALLHRGGSVRQRRAVRRRWRLAGRLGVLLALLVLPLAAWFYFGKPPAERGPGRKPVGVVGARIPVPQSARMAEIETKLQANYASQLASGNAGGRQQVAKTLLHQSAISDDPVFEFAALRWAARLSCEAEDFTLASEACARMAERFEIEPLALKREWFTKASPQALSTSGSASLARACAAAGFEAIGSDSYEFGTAFLDLAKPLASRSSRDYLGRQLDFLASEVERCRQEFALVSAWAKQLREQPGSPEANLRVGQYLCFVKNDWESGLSLMAHGSDESLRTIAGAELARPVRPRDQVTLGESWWKLSLTAAEAAKLPYQRRARFWFLRAIARVRGPEKMRLKGELEPRIRGVRCEPGEVHLFARVEGTEHIALFSHEWRWTSMNGSYNDHVGHLHLGDLKPRESRVLKNCGGTRLYPETVDFSTARLTVDQKARRRGKASLEIAEDHVRIVLIDAPSGQSSFEVTLSFGETPGREPR